MEPLLALFDSNEFGDKSMIFIYFLVQEKPNFLFSKDITQILYKMIINVTFLIISLSSPTKLNYS